MRPLATAARVVSVAAACLVALALAGGGPRAAEALPSSGHPAGAADGELTLFLAGDAIITQPWSGDDDPAFLALVDAIRAADVALVNLELVLHTFRGYAQADSGGGHMAARPEIAAELAWAGVDMVAHANNHTFDYGSEGVLETLDSVAAAGLALAGSGRDLQRARAPAYLPRPDGTVALVATASSFVPYGKASPSRPDMHGRPGLNPLTVAQVWYVGLPDLLARAAWGAADLLGVPHRPPPPGGDWGKLHALHIRVGAGFGPRRGYKVDHRDLEANLAAVREAAATAAGPVVFSIHAHEQGGWLTELAHRAIDAGADVFFAHGPHRMLGVEVYKGKPILYGLGDFVFQPHRIERFPGQFYEDRRLGDSATVEDARRSFVAGSPYFGEREPWEGVAAVLRFRGGRLREARLLPLDLGFDRSLPGRDKERLADDVSLGKPRLADDVLGRRIIGYVGDMSRPYGTAIRYLDDENAGVVELDQP